MNTGNNILYSFHIFIPNKAKLKLRTYLVAVFQVSRNTISVYVHEIRVAIRKL